MPIYEYWCVECRNQFERLRAMGSKDTDVTCPRCGSDVKRMLSVPAVVSRAGGKGDNSYEQLSNGESGGGCGCGGNCACGRG